MLDCRSSHAVSRSAGGAKINSHGGIHMESFMMICSIIASITSVIINAYTIFTIRKHLGKIAKDGLDKVEDKIKKIL
jgi:hypothetical protein